MRKRKKTVYKVLTKEELSAFFNCVDNYKFKTIFMLAYGSGLRIGEKRGDRMQYIDGLKDVIEILGGEEKQCIIHTDQGSVYASMAYNELIKDKNIVRSMSRAGKPTDNPVNESLKGWIKEELFIDFKLGECRDKESMIEVIERYIKFYNSQRPCYAIGYDTPNNYYEKYINREIECKDTFSKRNLTEVPKFVQKRMSTFENKKT